MLAIGLEPTRVGEAELFFEYCHELVPTGGKEGKETNEKGVIVPKWWKVFEEEKKEAALGGLSDFV
jgi:hypothetical protein